MTKPIKPIKMSKFLNEPEEDLDPRFYTEAKEDITYDAIVIGAGVIGPCLAKCLAQKGKKVLIIEKEWQEPDRIVGELMQPGGVRALRELGMIQAINNIDAQPITGYTVMYNGEKVAIKYSHKDKSGPLDLLSSDIVHDGNDKILSGDKTLNYNDFENDERERGVAFVHGRFLTNLRNMCLAEPNVTPLAGNVIEVMKNKVGEVIGVRVDVPNNRGKCEFKAHITFVVDGVFSKFRRELASDFKTTSSSSFIGMSLFNADMPTKNNGHVILGANHSPVLVYQISPQETRILCAFNSKKAPTNISKWMIGSVQPHIPEQLRPSFDKALAEGKFRSMPNQFVCARQNDVTGLCVIGDALNMRHPLGGGGMTVGLKDTVLLIKKIGDLDFSDRETVLDELLDFHYERKSYDSVINVLSIALYSLFAADNEYLAILQRGCFAYFQRGDDCLEKPIMFLSGVLPRPFLLTKVFFAVALYSVYLNYEKRGAVGFPVAFFEGFAILFTAARVFTPFLYNELIG